MRTFYAANKKKDISQSYNKRALNKNPIKPAKVFYPFPSAYNHPPKYLSLQSSTMDKLSTLARFKAKCPFLHRTSQSTLRTLCTTTSARYPTLSQLTERATKCPVMGPALVQRSTQIAQSAGYASVAGAADVQNIHAHEGIFPIPTEENIAKCPHAAAARRAAQMAEELARAKKTSAKFSHSAAGVNKAARPQAISSHFDYEAFYNAELDKKHQDKSYRYFNNINRIAAKFPVAHTGTVEEEVTVWCANDYLGMGKNPVVLDTMQ